MNHNQRYVITIKGTVTVDAMNEEEARGLIDLLDLNEFEVTDVEHLGRSVSCAEADE